MMMNRFQLFYRCFFLVLSRVAVLAARRLGILFNMR